ncbi:MAG: hypothetical protein ACNI3C_05235 [Candidatus Marinarcus sp.]|uniref:hypothetical protein n=1 Tax=Candidatus Marinarcus sp. TaxID=3100987 RepID=UPI003AFFE331
MTNFYNYLKDNSILKEHSYLRNPNVVATLLNKKLKDKKILFYGDGSHTKEVISFLDKDSIDIVGIISDISIEHMYIREDFEYPLFDIKDVDLYDFDYIILLGYWNSRNLYLFITKYNLESSKVFLPYKTKELIDIADKKGHINYIRKTKKPLVCLILNSDRRDFISSASKYLKKYFELVKVYISNDVVYESNDSFNEVFFISGNFNFLEKFFEKNNPDAVIFFHSGQLEVATARLVQIMCKNKIKYIYSTTDFFFNNAFCMDDKLLAKTFNIEENKFNILKKVEHEIIQNADGIITNWGGSYMENELNADALFSSYFHNNTFFKNIQFDPRRIKVCYTGNLGMDIKNDFHKITTLDNVFEKLLENQISMYIYNFQLKSNIFYPYDKLKKYDNFYWKNFVKTEQMPEELSNYHFGLNVLNIGKTQLKIFDTLFKSLFQAKIATYICAGLPIIVSKEYKILYEFVSDNKIGFGTDIENICSDINKISEDTFNLYKQNIYYYQQNFLNNNLGAKDIADYITKSLSK